VGGQSGDPNKVADAYLSPSVTFRHLPSRGPPVPKRRNDAIPRARKDCRASGSHAPATFSAPATPEAEACAPSSPPEPA